MWLLLRIHLLPQPLHLEGRERLKGCVRDPRADTSNAGSDESKALELYVASRGTGLSDEGVSVRP